MRKATSVLVCLLGLVLLAGCRTVPPPAPEPEQAEQPDESRLRRYASTRARLDSPDPDVREKAAVALLSMEAPAAATPVLETLRGADDPAVRISMVRAAAFTADHRCFDALLDAVSDPDPQVREAAAAALAHFTRPSEVTAMVEYASDPTVGDTRRQLLFRALGQGLALRAVPVLIAGLARETEETRMAAWEALRRIARRDLPPDPEKWREWWQTNRYRNREDLLEEHLREVSTELRLRNDTLEQMRDQQQALMDVVEHLGEEDLSTLLAALSSLHDVVRRYAGFRLAAVAERAASGTLLDDQEVYADLREALNDENPRVRQNVMKFVKEAGGQYKNDLIRQALQGEDPGVLAIAVQEVSTTTGPEAIARLEALVVDSPHAEVREEAANMLGNVGGEQSWQALVEALDDSEENVRWFAVEGLRKLGATQAFQRVSEVLLEDESARVRAQAAIALGELGQPASFGALRQALVGDPSEQVRDKAAAALTALAEGSPETMATVARTFRDEGYLDRSRQILSRLIEQFGDDPEQTDRVVSARRELAEVMMEQEDYTAAAATFEQLLADGYDGELRRKFVDALLKAGEGAAAIEKLRQWLGAEPPAEEGAEGGAAGGVEEGTEPEGETETGSAEGVGAERPMETADDELLMLALDTAERLREQENGPGADALIELAARRTGETTDSAVTERIEALKQRPGP